MAEPRFAITVHPLIDVDGLTAREGAPCATVEGDDLPMAMHRAGKGAAAWMADSDERPIAFRVHVVVAPEEVMGKPPGD